MSNVHANVAIPADALDHVQPGTTFEKTSIGWNVKWVDGGTVVHLQGPTITEALGSHGAQVLHVFPEIRPDPRTEPEVVDVAEIPDEPWFLYDSGMIPDGPSADGGWPPLPEDAE